MNRLHIRAAALLTALLLAGAAMPAAWAEPAEITISSVEELEAFAKNCSLDVWSQGKTVRLTRDLDLTGRTFAPIPTFGGTFLGEGHQISGLRITAAGSDMGLFRRLQEGAVVQDLSVSGVVRPSGSAVNVGGIVGSNAGAVRNCAFSGIVEGSSATGGIAGLNRESGELAGTATSGAVSGEAFTGGAAGRNLGSLLQCENAASVNTAAPDENAALDMAALAAPLETVQTSEDGFLKSHSDTGGIAGYSAGILSGCLNTGAVGYPHVGYNVGGIVGRQNGYLSGCTNRGTVHGRKDVGGIAGQAEPDIALAPDAGALQRLRQELDSLEALIDRAIGDAQGRGDAIAGQLASMGDHAGAARDSAKDLLDRAQDFVDGNTGVLNTLTADLTGALEGVLPAMDALADASGGLSDLTDRLEDAVDALAGSVSGGQDAAADAGDAVDLLRRAGGLLEDGAAALRRAVRALQRAIVVQDQAAADAALTDLTAALASLASGADQAESALEGFRTALDSLRAALGPEGAGLEAVQAALEQARTALAGMASGLRTAAAGLRQLAGAAVRLGGSLRLDGSQLRQALSDAGAGLDGLHSAAGQLNNALAGLRRAMEGLGTLARDLGDAMAQLADAAALGEPVGRQLESAFRILREQAAALAETGPREFLPLGEEARAAGDGLFSALSAVSGGLEGLRLELEETGDQLAGDLQAINRQCGAVFSVLADALEHRDDEDVQVLEDASDRDVSATRQGKLAACTNEGPVDGDRNVGGVAGAMSIEVDLDPEDDLNLSLGGTYETKAVLEDCVNLAAVTAKKDCAGGLAGRMDLGTVIGCENYGAVASTDGGCVGGIAGLTEGVVRESWAKCTLSGESGVGGIAGRTGEEGSLWRTAGGSLRDCAAIATVLEGTECVGAIAGSAEAASVRNCVFVDTGTAGIDGVSYAGSAEPIAFEDLRQRPGVPARLTAFTLTLTAEGQTVQVIPFAYGQDLSRLELPAPPEREGFYGTWPDFDVSGRASDLTLEAVYTPWVTLVASSAREGRRALALAEGQFTGDVLLEVRDSALPPPPAGAGGDVWEIALVGAEAGRVPLRLLNRAGGRASVWRYDGRQWVSVPARSNGSYLCLTMEGVSGVFCVHSAAGNGTVLLLAAASAALLAGAALLLKRRRKRKS